MNERNNESRNGGRNENDAVDLVATAQAVQQAGSRPWLVYCTQKVHFSTTPSGRVGVYTSRPSWRTSSG